MQLCPGFLVAAVNPQIKTRKLAEIAMGKMTPRQLDDMCHNRTNAPQQSSILFDRVVGAAKHRKRK
jgi:hypothetical protein